MTTHKQALRAALQVARGNRKKRSAVVTGLVMLGGCGGESGDTSNQQDATLSSANDAAPMNNDAEALVDALDQAAEDSLSAEVEARADSASTQEVSGPDGESSPEPGDAGALLEDATQSDADTISADDVSTPGDIGPSTDDASSSDAGDEEESDVVECLDTCWQPNGVSCNEHMDCAVPEPIVGSCAASGEECIYNFECEESNDCVGGMPSVFPSLDPETGELYPYSSGVACFNGVCHEGDQISTEAQACCSFSFSDNLPWCDDLSAPLGGCTPWGPPAPPVHDGQTLAQRVKQWLS